MFLRSMFSVLSFVSISLFSNTALSQNAFRQDREGWIYVQVGGEPYERGFNYGRLVAPEIDDLLSTLKVYLLENTKQDWDWYRSTSQKLFIPKLSSNDEYRLEMSGIADALADQGYNYDLLDIIAMNSFMEVAEYYLPSIQKSGEKRSPMLRCSAFIATGTWTSDGKIVMGHNSWNDYIIGQRWKVILDIRPSSGQSILMQTGPGFIHSGTDFLVNSAGIIITETTIGNFKGFDVKGMPEFYRARKAAQYSQSVDDVYSILRKQNNGGYANTWLVGDINTNEIAKIELGLINVALYRSQEGYYHGENYVDDSKMILDETGPTLWNTTTSWPFDLANTNTITARAMRWHALMKKFKGKITVEYAKMFLADQIEQATGKFTEGGFVLMARMEKTNRPEIPGAVAPRPFGANEGKAIDASLARNMSFWARMGHPDGSAFKWASFWQQNPAFAWQAPYLKDLVAHQWALFAANATKRRR